MWLRRVLFGNEPGFLFYLKYITMKDKILIIVWTILSFPVMMLTAQDDFRIAGQRTDGTPIAENSIMAYGSNGLFRIVDSNGDNVQFNNLVWSCDIFIELKSDKTVRTLVYQSEKYASEFCLVLDSFPKLLSGYDWKHDTGSDTRRYLMSEINVEGVTENQETVKKKLPVYLEFCPTKPIVQVLNIEKKSDWDIYIIDFICSAERADFYKLGIETSDGVYIYDYDKIPYHMEQLFELEDDQFWVYAQNEFGWSSSEPVYPKRLWASNEIVTVSEGWKMYPNPAHGYVYLENVKKSGCKFELKIFDKQGCCLWSESTVQLPTKIDISMLSPGLYFVQLIEDNGDMRNEKLLIK